MGATADYNRLLDELDNWKKIAAYLAECHAANLHEAELTRCSKSRRKRFQSIMDKSAEMLKSGEPLRENTLFYETANDRVFNAIKRLEDHSKRVDRLLASRSR